MKPRLYLTGDSNLAPLANKLSLDFEVAEGAFNTWYSDIVFDSSNELLSSEYVCVILSPRVLTDVPHLREWIDTMLDEIATWSRRHILITTVVPDPALSWFSRLGDLSTEINQRILERSNLIPWLSVVDLQGFFVKYGVEKVYDPRLETLGRIYFNNYGTEKLADYIRRYYNAVQGKRKKVLVLDLDNTLWGGVVGEDGINGIRLGGSGEGYAFLRFQYMLKLLKDSGILLTIASKNDEDLGLDTIRKHPDMVLTLEDFVTHRINWEPKPESIRSIADELSLGLDSFVFFDDTPFERRMVCEFLPEVDVIDVPRDPAYYVQTLTEYSGFDTLEITPEDQQKTTMYQQEAKRTTLAATAKTKQEFLDGLCMVATIDPVTSDGLNRVHQLINKTNQFNLTSKRYQLNELKYFLDSPDHIMYTIRLKDNLGESGIVGVVIIVIKATNHWILDTFLLSCRVIGRTLEFAILRWLVERMISFDIETLAAEYIETPRNHLAREFLESAGFVIEGGEYTLDLSKELPKTYVKLGGE